MEWNFNILCLDSDPQSLEFYQRVFSSPNKKDYQFVPKMRDEEDILSLKETTRIYKSDYNYQIFLTSTGKEAIRKAEELKSQGEELAVGFFDIRIPGIPDGLETIQELKEVFPNILCAVVGSQTDHGMAQIRQVFASKDEWLYIKKPLVKEEIEQTACNLISVWNLRKEQDINISRLRQGQETLQRLLTVTPKIFRLQSYNELSENVLNEAANLLGSQDAFLALRGSNNLLEFTAGIGKFIAKNKEEGQKFLQILENRAEWDQGGVVPLSIEERPLGILFFRQLSSRATEMLEVFTSQVSYAFENFQLQKEVEKQKVREQELKIATRIQNSLLPKKIPQSKYIDIYGLMYSAKEIGGDYYDFIPLKNSEDFYICIGDVSGKGVAAGLIMSEVRSFIRALARPSPSPRELLDKVAELLEEDLWGTGKFMSMLALKWNEREQEFHVSSAGHEHIIHYHAASKTCSTKMGGGVVLGLKHKMISANLKEEKLKLESGDVALLFTDGATEALNEKEEQFTLERLTGLAQKYAYFSIKDILEKICSDIFSYTGDMEQFDDITLVGIKMK